MSQSSFNLNAFDKLPKLQRSLLQLISIIYAPVATTPLASCAHRAGINNPSDGESFTLHTLRPILVDLIHQGFLQGHQGKYFCEPLYCEEILLTSISDGTFDHYSKQVLTSFSATESFGRVLWQSVEHGISHARIYLFQGRSEKLAHILELLHERYQYRESILSNPGFYPAIFGSPANEKLLNVLNDQMFSVAFLQLIEIGLENLHEQSQIWELLLKRQPNLNKFQSFQIYLMEPQTRYCLFTGNTELFPELPEGIQSQDTILKDKIIYDDRHLHWHLANCARQLTHGSNESAIQAYENAQEIYKSINNSRKGSFFIFNTEAEKFYVLALLTTGDKKQLALALKILKKVNRCTDYEILSAYANTQQTRDI